MKIVKDEEQTPAPEIKGDGAALIKFDPAKKYVWAKDDQFVFNGGEYGLLLNTLREILATPEAQRIMLAQRASQVVEAALIEAVESGKVKEAEQK